MRSASDIKPFPGVQLQSRLSGADLKTPAGGGVEEAGGQSRPSTVVKDEIVVIAA